VGQEYSVVWQPGSDVAMVPEGNVHIWRASLNQPTDVLHELAQYLSPDEQAKVERLRFVQHQQRSLFSRGLLRVLLGRYLSADPASLKFNYGEQGKPALCRETNGPNLQFNLAHSEHLVVYAIALNHPVGVDVEYQRAMTNMTEIAQRFFSPAEHQALAQLPVASQRKAFFQYWTAKEAVLKATGEGLMGLSKVEIAVLDGSLRLQGDLARRYPSQRWQIRLFEPEENYSGAIAIPLPEAKFLFFEW
jgi:4'-phosphopantetheinyl transferase